MKWAEVTADCFMVQRGKRTRGAGKNIVTINADKQSRHIIGKKYVDGKSVFFGTPKDAQKLVDEFSGKGKIIPNQPRERVNFGKVIGYYVDSETHKQIHTTCGIIHYSKTGCHIVPSDPYWEKK